MNCKQSQVLIRTLPRSEWSVHERQAADAHVSTCAECARLLQAEQRLDATLQSLFEPRPPNTIAPVVMARIHSQPRYHAPAPRRARSALSALSRWLGVAAAIGAYLFSFVQGAGTVLSIPFLAPAAMNASTMVFAGGLLLYLGGLFTPWSRSPRDVSAE